MRLRTCLSSALLLAVSTAALAQEPLAPPPSNPFGDGGGAQPPAPPVLDPFGGAPAGNQPPAPGVTGASGEATPGDTSVDLEKDKGWLDEMIESKALIKTQLKGRMASMWVGEPFIDLTAADQDKLIRLAYKVLTGKEEFKVPPPMTIYASDGQRQGPKLGVYMINPKGDKINITRPQRVQQPPPGLVPQQPTPADDDDLF